MLSICNEIVIDMDIIFNNKKSICIKYSDIRMLEETVLNHISLTWSNQVRHLGIFFTINLLRKQKVLLLIM